MLDTQSLQGFSLFEGFTEQTLQNLLSKARLVYLPAGDVIKRCRKNTYSLHFLFNGKLAVESNFQKTTLLNHTGTSSNRPIEDTMGANSDIRAMSACAILSVDLRDIRLAQKAACEAVPYWKSEFLASPLARHLGEWNTCNLLDAMDVITVSAGEILVRRGDYGDAMFLIERGQAIVNTQFGSSGRGRSIELSPGRYFGEEALVTNSPRNAEVIMATDGVLRKMDKQQFDVCIKDSVILKADSTALQHLLEQPDENSVILDVRQANEFTRKHRKYSTNLPVQLLRDAIDELDLSKQYFVTPEGGSQSELATFLLRQAGFDAVLLAEAG
ncbi:MAG: cyclic nucleotide-binding domain-containing protein [Pseudomonadales bacterium]